MIPLRPPKPAGVAVLSQIVALAMGGAAVLWGALCLYVAAFPGPCGDNMGPGLIVIEAWVVGVPLGLLTLAVASFVKKGSPRLRRICLFTSLVVPELLADDFVFRGSLGVEPRGFDPFKN